jgi:hypothetical protein
LRVESLKTATRQNVIRPALARGEREALSLVAEVAEWLIVDDTAAAAYCAGIASPRAGILRELLAAERWVSFRSLGSVTGKVVLLSPQLYAELIALAGEDPS